MKYAIALLLALSMSAAASVYDLYGDVVGDIYDYGNYVEGSIVVNGRRVVVEGEWIGDCKVRLTSGHETYIANTDCENQD